MVSLTNASFPKWFYSFTISSVVWKSSCHYIFIHSWCCQSFICWPFWWVFCRSSCLVFISLMFGKRTLFMYSLAVWRASPVRCLFKSFAHFSVGLSFISYWFMGVLYVVSTQALCQLYTHCQYLLPLYELTFHSLIGVFGEQNFLILT